MTETATSIEALLRPYAAHQCEACTGSGRIGPEMSITIVAHSFNPKCEGCHGTGLDPRFDALRVHDWELGCWNDCERCHACELTYDQGAAAPIMPYCLRIDLGSGIRVAAACGLYVVHLGDGMGLTQGDWLATLQAWGSQKRWDGYGDTETDALARAFVAAVPLGG